MPISLTALPPVLRDMIESGHDGQGNHASRSERDFVVIQGLIAEGFDDAQIEEVYEAFPIGEKFYEAGIGYLHRTIANARQTVKRVRIKYADINEYSSHTTRLQLCLVVDENEDDAGKIIRCGVTVPNGQEATRSDSNVRCGIEKLWRRFWYAAGFDERPCEMEWSASSLLGRRLRVRLRGGNGYPVASFHRVGKS